MKEILATVGDWAVVHGIRILVIIIAGYVLLKLAQMLSTRLFRFLEHGRDDAEARKRSDTLSSLVRNVLRIGILGVTAMMVIDEIGIEIGPILAAAGIVGLAVGFGAQSLVKDVISGFFMLLEDQIRVGDVVTVAGKSGLVEQVGIRLTVLRDLGGNVHYIPNGQIDVVTNMTKDYSYALLEIGVAYREDTDEIVSIIREVDAGLRNDPAYSADILEGVEILGVDRFDDSAVILKARIRTVPIKQWRVAREFNRRLKKVFDDRGVEIPFPHVTIYAGKDKDGTAPPLDLRMVEKAS
jgi:moderate conductance mechanosensitive channel